MPPRRRLQIRLKQGRAIFGVDMKIVDGDGEELPWDGKAYGDLWSRARGSCKKYFKGEGGDPLVRLGWFPTGDVATIDPDGYMQITDRSKDVIKSGGEWISSIEHREHRGGASGRGDGGLHRRGASQVGRAADRGRW